MATLNDNELPLASADVHQVHDGVREFDWLMRAVLVLIVLLAATVAPTYAYAAVRTPKVLRDVEAGRDELVADSQSQGDTTVEPSIAVNAHDARNAVTVYQ